jgi:hypothetical protein
MKSLLLTKSSKNKSNCLIYEKTLKVLSNENKWWVETGIKKNYQSIVFDKLSTVLSASALFGPKCTLARGEP